MKARITLITLGVDDLDGAGGAGAVMHRHSLEFPAWRRSA